MQFKERKTIEQIEESSDFVPKFDENGLIPVITTDIVSGEVLMQGFMNKDALLETIQSGLATYFSRSRQVIWKKGATSGLYQHVEEMRIDDDQDCIWLRVKVDGGASCHVGYRSCFYRSVPIQTNIAVDELQLSFTENQKVFDPKDVYGDAPNPTII